MPRKIRSLMFLAMLVFLFAFMPAFTPCAFAGSVDKLDPELRKLGPQEEAAVIVRLNGGPDRTGIMSKFRDVPRRQRIGLAVQAMREGAEKARKGVSGIIQTRKMQGQVRDYKALWVADGMSMTASRSVLDELAANPDVAYIYPDRVIPFTDVLPVPPPPSGANLDVIRAREVQALGFTGQGVVVAGIDTGVDAQHPALAPSYRGGPNSWFDPYGEHSTPFDGIGHGTATTGVMVARGPTGIVYGVAPGAKWIAAKIFNNAGEATLSGIHAAYQWALDPDGNPATDDAPDIVNNSWGNAQTGICDQEFDADIQTLRAAGILPVFSAGNDGPAGNTDASPANNADAFSVGATDNTDVIAPFSSRGPSACDGSVFPQVCAPGVEVITTDLSYGGKQNYAYMSGTSFSAPAVSGAAALLLSAFPAMPVDDVQQLLIDTSKDLGDSGADNVYGYGRIDALKALQSSPPANVSAAAAAGVEGQAQQVNAVWSSPWGAGKIKTAYLQAGSGGPASIIKLKYEQDANLLYMLNDAGTGWLGGFAPGSANLIAGKNGTLDCANTTVTPTGNNLAVSFNITPGAGFFGSQALSLYVYDFVMGHPANWEQKGVWNIAPKTPTPFNVSVAAPDGNEGAAQQVVAKWMDTGGASLLRFVFLQVGTGGPANIIKLKYDRGKNLLYVLDGAGTAWLGGFAPGSANLIAGKNGTLDCAATAVAVAGNDLTVSFNITPATGYTGKKPLYEYAYDKYMKPTAAWSFMGYWRIKSTPPVNLSAAGTAGTTGSPLTVSATWRDANGANDLKIVYLQVGTKAGGLIKLRYDRASNKLYVLSYAGNSWLGGYAPGSAFTIVGQYGTLYCAGTAVSQTATDLTVDFSLEAETGYAGVKPLSLYAYDNDMNHPATWEQKGTWNLSDP